MIKNKLDYLSIQTPPDVWLEILKKVPLNKDYEFFEPFCGEGSLYNQVENEKNFCEIMKGKDIFDYDFVSSNAEVVWTNPPFVCSIPDKKGVFKERNSVYFFLEMFITRLPKLKQIGFLINSKSWNSLTPCRLSRLEKLGWSISNLVILNCNYWWGIYYFVVFEKDITNKPIKVIEKPFTKKFTQVEN